MTNYLLQKVSAGLVGAPVLALGVEYHSVQAGTSFHYEVTDLGTLGSNGSSAYGINDAGIVVGNSSIPKQGSHAFVWDHAPSSLSLPYRL